MRRIPNHQEAQNTRAMKVWTQPNDSDMMGSLWASYNIDLLENEGKVRLGKRLLLNTATADVAEITSYPVGFRFFNNGSDSSFYTAAGASGTGYVFKASSITGNFSKVTTAGAPATVDSLYSDIETGFGELYISSASNAKVYYLNGSNVWSNLSAGGAGSSMMMTFYGNRMYVTKNGNIIQSWDSTHTVVSSGQYSLTLGTGERITFLRAASNRIWIGTVNQFGNKGYIYEWDGASNQTTRSYRLKSAGALACVIMDDIPYCIDSNGEMIYWNGGTFKTIAKLNRRRNKPLFNPFYVSNQRFIHPNGGSIIRGRINWLIDGTNYDASSHNGSQEETIPSGIWEFVPPRPGEELGTLYHKHSFGLTKSAGTIGDYGQIRIFGAGGLNEILTAQSPVTTNGKFLAGCSYYTDATTTTSGIFYDDSDDTLQKAAYIVTSKIYSDNITDVWQTLFYRFKKLRTSTDKMVVKWRRVESEPVEATITWTSTTTFTTTTDVSSYWTSGTGGEVEVVQGVGSGRCSHITSIVNNAGTYTVTVDETYTTASNQTAKARFQSWNKLTSTVYGDTSVDFNDIGLPSSLSSTWVQFKVWMLFTGNMEFEDITLQNKASQTANYK